MRQTPYAPPCGGLLYTEPAFSVQGYEEVVQSLTGYTRWYLLANYDIHPDGERFLFVGAASTTSGEEVSEKLVIVANWFEELRQRLGN